MSVRTDVVRVARTSQTADKDNIFPGQEPSLKSHYRLKGRTARRQRRGGKSGSEEREDPRKRGRERRLKSRGGGEKKKREENLRNSKYRRRMGEGERFQTEKTKGRRAQQKQQIKEVRK